MNQKNAFDDIIPPGQTLTKRSIRNIPVREKKPNKIDELLEETVEMRAEHHNPPPVYTPPETFVSDNPRPRRALFGILAAIVILLLGGAYLAFSRGTVVDVTLKTETIPVELLASSTADSFSASNTLPYKVIAIQKEGTKEVNATGAATKVEKKASGTIVIYNTSAESQQLIATTRFETPEGLVYRIDKGVTIPANGNVEAVAYADVPGESYNVGMKDFTIPGFKGTPKYEKFYARSKTGMAGGFVGTMPQISDADLKAANAELEQSLIAAASAQLATEKPETHVFFKEGARTSFVSSVSPSSESGKGVVKGTLTMEALIFDKAAVEKAIADTKNGQQYRYDNLEALVLTIQNNPPVTTFISNPVLSVKLAGMLTTGQSFDVEALKRVLSGKAKAQLPELLRMYPEISQAEATVRPFWSSSFPANPEKIKINITK